MRSFEVAQHLGDDLDVALVDHAGADKAQVDLFFCPVERNWSDGVVGIALGDVDVVHVGVSYHRLNDLVEINDDFGKILGIVVR